MGLRVRVDTIDASWKLDQRKPRNDRLGAIAGLETKGATDVAAAMRAALPSDCKVQ